jgi:MFS family permease
LAQPSTGVRSDDAPEQTHGSLWRNRDFVFLWNGQLVSTLGTDISQLATPLLALALTGSPAQAGFLSAAQVLPYLVSSLPAGALVDRWDRKRIMIVCDAVRAVVLAGIPLAALFGQLSIVQLNATALISGTLFVFFNLAEAACLSRVVPTEQLPSATAQNEGGQITAGLIAPPLGGILFSVAHAVPFLADAISYCASVVTLCYIRTPFQAARTATPWALRTEIAEGLVWLWRQPLIRYMAFLTGGLNFGNAAIDLIVIVVARPQHVPPAAIGLIFTVASVGGLAGSVLAPRIQRRYRFGQVIAGTVWLNALLWPFVALVPNPLLLGVVLAGMFITSPIYNAVQYSYRLSVIPDALQGRVNSVFRLLGDATMPLGTALVGVVLQRAGIATTVLVFSLVVLLLAVLTSLNKHARQAAARIEVAPD